MEDIAIFRRWKRDGSRNRMSLAAAAGNAERNHPGLTAAEAERLLRAGVAIETPHSVLYEAGRVPDQIRRLDGTVTTLAEYVQQTPDAAA